MIQNPYTSMIGYYSSSRISRASRITRASRTSIASIATICSSITTPIWGGDTILRRMLLAALLCLLGWGEAWGISQTKLTVNIVGGGKVAITKSNSAPSSYSDTSVSESIYHGWTIGTTDTYYIWVQPNTGFNIASMSGDFTDNTNKTSGQYYQVSFKGSTTGVNKTVTITFQTTYYFSATATPNYESFGSASAEVGDASIVSVNASESTTATFTATPNSSYEFAGWGTSQNAASYESTANPYQPTITNSTPGSTANKTLYAIFKPVFNFTATAEKINGSYGAVSATVTPKLLGNPTDTSKSTQATFTATPNENCTFIGWYYDETHTNQASDNAIYTATITNNQIGSTAGLTLYAWFKTNQTISFSSTTYDKNIVLGSTSTGAAKATASSGLAVTYSSSNSNVVSVNGDGDVTAESLSNDDITITATQEGNDEYNPVSITRDFHVIAKMTTTFTTTGLSLGQSSTIYVDDKPTITVKDEGTGFTYSSSDEKVVSISKDSEVITLTALKVGESKITLTQPETSTHSAVTQTYNISVEKVANTLELGLGSQTAQVDGTITVDTGNINNTTTSIAATITDQVLSSSVNNGENVIVYEDGVIKAKNAGTAKITFTQAETDKYTGFTSTTYEITVTKIANPISITLNEGNATSIKLKYGETATLGYTSAHSDATISVKRTSGNYTTLSENIITAGDAAGTDLYEVVQPETYKYEVGYATFSIRVNNTTEEEMYIINDESSYANWTLTTLTSYSFEGHPGDVVIFEAKRAGGGSNSGFYLDYSTDNGATWQEKWYFISTDTDWNTYSVTLPEGVTNIRFELYTGSTLNKNVRNVKVTRKTYLKATSDKTDLGTVYTGNTATATFTVDYSTTNGGNIQVSSSNTNFAVSTDEIATTTNSDGTTSLTVTYTPNPNMLGEESALITISDLFYTQQITLTATALKRDNTLAVISDQAIMVDDVVTNVYSNKNSGAEISYSLSKEGVISYDVINNTVKAIGAGEVTLTLTQAENDTHLGSTQLVKFTVSKYDQTIAWDNDLTSEQRTLNVGGSISTNTATASSGLSVTYSSSNSNAIEVDPVTGVLTARASGSNIAITATQAGNYKYGEASITRYFTVISKIDAVVVTSLQVGGTNTLTIGEEPVTIGCNAMLSMENFTIGGNEAGYVQASFDNNTLTITPVKVGGTVTIKLDRPEDDGYNAVCQTYAIAVQGPVLTLDPSCAPDVRYPDTEYSKVTLQRTLGPGYVSISLPFTTTVQDLVGEGYDADEDWIAQMSVVTYNAQDGYTLYFSKLDDGILHANQPYVLHLGNEVDKPVFTNVMVSEPAPAEHRPSGGVNLPEANYADWRMVANFEPAFPMDGRYGVVTSLGCIKRGGATSFLNAYTSYVEDVSGSAAHSEARSVYMDGDATGILQMNADAERLGQDSVYDLQGRRQQSVGRGIVIVRGSDGKVRKVLH